MKGIIARTALRAAVILCIPAAIARAGDGTIPVLSASDGSRAWVEISGSGNRKTARPALAVPGETVRRMTPADGNGRAQVVPPRGGKAGEGNDPRNVEDLLRRHKSRLVRETPDGISLGGALGLAGEVREALRKGKDDEEKLDAVVRILNDTVERDSLSEDHEPEESIASSVPAKPAVSSTGSVRY